MANFTGHGPAPSLEGIYHYPVSAYSLLHGYGINYGRFYGDFVELPEDLWSSAPAYYIVGWGKVYGKYYGGLSVTPPYTPLYFEAGYGNNYGRFYGFHLNVPLNIIISEFEELGGAGTRTDNLPVSYASVNHTGYKAPTLTDVFYGRLLVEPAHLDYGILVSTQTKEVIAWNGYLTTSIDLDALLLSGFDGITIVGDTPPSTFAPLQERTYEIIVTTDGPPTIDAQVRFDWEAGYEDNIVTIEGRRIVLYPYLYKPGMTESLLWLTTVLTSDDGLEQRQSIREAPRQRFAVRSFIRTEEHARADNILYGWRHQIWAIPVWSEGRNPTNPVTASDTTIDVDTRFGDFRADSLAVIWKSEREFDLFTILSFTDTEITLDRGVNDDYGLDAIIAPVRSGRMVQDPQRTSKGHNAQLNVLFEADDNELLSVGASAIQYIAEDTYLDQPDLPGGRSFNEKYVRDIRIIDYKTGVVTQFSTWDDTKLDREFLVILEGLEAVWNFREWLHRRAGRQRPFWMPSFERNMLVTGTGNIGLTIVIREDSNRSQGSARDHIYIRMKDGTEYLRAVLSITDAGGGNNNVGIDSSISENQEDIDFISYMGLKRLSSDRIQLKWLANHVVECTVPIKEIEP